MRSKILYPVWGALYILCVCLGAISQRNTATDVALTGISLLFFIPGFMLLFDAIRNHNTKTLKTLRLLSAASLGLTVLALIGNILSTMGSSLLGDIAYGILLIVSAPMLCCKFWFLSLLLWAVLFYASFPQKQKK